MAKILGIEVKNLKGFMGHEGYSLQGNLYMDGKKVGFWSQDGNGGPDDFDFDDKEKEKAFETRVKQYYDRPHVDEFALFNVKPEDFDINNLPMKTGCKYESSADEFFMQELTHLAEKEKKLKKGLKKGYTALISCEFHHIRGPLPLDFSYLVSGDIEKNAKNILAEGLKKGPTAHVSVYKSVDDFIVE